MIYLQRFLGHTDIMSICPEVKMLAVVVVLFLVAGMGDSVILNKCGLKKQLEASLTLPQVVLNQTTPADLLAKIVCHIQLTTGFNTSSVKLITEPSKAKNSWGHSGRKGRSVGSGKNKGRPTSNVTRPTSAESSSSGESHGYDGIKSCTLYGLFQLSNRVACNSTLSPTLNLCGLKCNMLIDDNISDDLACVQVLLNTMAAVTPNPLHADHIRKMISSIYKTECANVVASSYFADC
ncbi:lysozyme C, milk isozyme [Myxocyprinus asiaticus]|uniref:lysozyme C, milk isozyme n=1 Tax=Myxocyprinus asiaticus TaxID=70543 RepID=UPI0022233F2E|nr:lysozyme C, milk isozyme [Myxocyprinus asiaticus]